MSNFYAVKIGVSPGIYETWSECENNVKGFSNARYKKFKTYAKAEKYMKDDNINKSKTNKNIKNTKNNENINNAKNEEDEKLNNIEEDKKLNNIEEDNKIVDDNYDFDTCINIYTDGSCINNGTDDAIGGYGVYFQNDFKDSISKKLKKNEEHKITNNRAELKAILSGLKKLKNEIMDGKQIIVHTDSMYCIQVLVKKNTYDKILKNKPVPNNDYIKIGYRILNENSNIKIHHVYSHTEKEDVHSENNKKADMLANQAIKNEIKNIKFTFGKYKNKTFEEVSNINLEYFNWCVINSKKQIHDIKLFLDTYYNLDTQIKK